MRHHTSVHSGTKTRVASRLAGLAITAVLATSLTACGSASIPTCSEFAAMHPDTGLLTGLNDQQTNALKASLKNRGFDDGAWNQAIGKTEVLAYCNIFGGVANANQGQPISNAH